MRALLSLTCGAPGRVGVSAAALTLILFAYFCQLGALLIALAYTTVWGTIFGIWFFSLAIVGAATSVVDQTPAPAPREDPHG